MKKALYVVVAWVGIGMFVVPMFGIDCGFKYGFYIYCYMTVCMCLSGYGITKLTSDIGG